ncbi:VENN motif pre-toxin domain-containing protein, partial [Xanthomonas oryzae pv. oryzicola]|nr:VENN motif pre-toxin domain-containing protein [Xanthomonas oryzae pv. oryzicola]
SIAGGALAGAAGELGAKYLTQTLYGDDPRAIDPVTGKFNPNLLPEQDKQMIVALSQAVGAIAGGMAGGSLADAATTANIAKNSVENNFLGKESPLKNPQTASIARPHLRFWRAGTASFHYSTYW